MLVLLVIHTLHTVHSSIEGLGIRLGGDCFFRVVGCYIHVKVATYHIEVAMYSTYTGEASSLTPLLLDLFYHHHHQYSWRRYTYLHVPFSELHTPLAAQVNGPGCAIDSTTYLPTYQSLPGELRDETVDSCAYVCIYEY